MIVIKLSWSQVLYVSTPLFALQRTYKKIKIKSNQNILSSLPIKKNP